MNTWGPAGCIANKRTIFGWWDESYKKATLREKATAAKLAARQRMRFALTWAGILRESIRRAELAAAAPIGNSREDAHRQD